MPLTEEKAQWVREFEEACKTLKPTPLTHQFVMLGVQGPVQAQHCKDNEEEHDFDPLFNWHIWHVLRDTGMLAKVRRVLLNDVRTIADPWDDCGRIAHRGFSLGVISNFLVENRNEEWFPQ